MPLGGALTIGAAGAEVGLGVAKSIEGFSDERRAKREMANLKTPFYKIQNEYQQNRDLAAQEAQGGLSSGAKDYLTQEGQRGVGAGIGAIQQGGGDVNNIAKLLQGYNQQLGSTAVADAQMHTDNINRFMERNKDFAGQETMQWSLNEYQPYERKLNELKQRMAAGKQNGFGGLSDAISGVSAAGTGMQNAALNKSAIASNNAALAPTVFGGNFQQQPIVAPTLNATGGQAPQSLPNQAPPVGVVNSGFGGASNYMSGYKEDYGGLGWTPQ